ncbi:MAG TPA: Vi polysaccharide biosynthesis UDP-N-acetylglucosamine C-6 dehydrogenase TviB [Gammaproteobacteria bacterium]|nr:Vi polysaccharide biosynthesis UDP-N-acetylglucosamine C-6 dehydrogenase TviB [Gammaproteobacteria bacterium]
MKSPKDARIGIIGLGYVGLPLAVEFGKHYPTVGFDIKAPRIAELKEGRDSTLETTPEELKSAKQLTFTTDKNDLRQCNTFIVTVPTPVGKNNRPVLLPLKGASETVGSVLKKGDVVVYESTVYPGCTEEYCVPILEELSGLKFNKDFFAGYSPERINPGDKEHRLPSIKKVTSGSTPEIADYVDALYGSIITAGTHKASSLRVAEAAKVIENTQRDINIALMNELSMIFNRLGIDTQEVLQAAGTKWNFLKFTPGLVGGHCIGVDPYYLTYKAEDVGYRPEIILAGRRLNDSMAEHVASRMIKLMIKRNIQPSGARVLCLGLTFKENCPDVRNTKVADVVKELQSFGCQVDVYDPWADANEARHEYGISLVAKPDTGRYDAIVVAVAHKEFMALGTKGIRAFGSPNVVIFDIKHVLPKTDSDGRL